MCLKYSLQEQESGLCDCVIRRRELAMASIHHTFIINCHTGTHVCFTGDPRPVPVKSRAPSTRDRLRTCFTHCINNQSCRSDSSCKAKDCGKPVVPVGDCQSSLVPAEGNHNGCQTPLYKALQDSLKQFLRGVASCLRTQKP